MSDFNTPAPALRIRIHCVQTAVHTWSTTCAHLLLDPEDVIEVPSTICFPHGLDGPLAQVLQFRECETLVHRHQSHHYGLLHCHFEQQFSNAITQRAQSCFQHTGDCVSEVAFVAIGFAVAGIKADCFFDILILRGAAIRFIFPADHVPRLVRQPHDMAVLTVLNHMREYHHSAEWAKVASTCWKRRVVL